MKPKKVMELNYVIAKMLTKGEFDARVLIEEYGEGFQPNVCESMLALAIRLDEHSALASMLDLGIGETSVRNLVKYATLRGTSKTVNVIMEYGARQGTTFDLYQRGDSPEPDDDTIEITITGNLRTGEATVDAMADSPEQVLDILKAARKGIKKHMNS